MISTRKRVQEALKDPESKSTLLDNYISREELWACTTCNACIEACPLNIDPLDIIIQMRQYLVMEESSAPASLNVMNTNIENNGDDQNSFKNLVCHYKLNTTRKIAKK